MAVLYGISRRMLVVGVATLLASIMGLTAPANHASADSMAANGADRAAAKVTIDHMLSRPQVGMTFAFRGYAGRGELVTLQMRAAGRHSWRSVGTDRTYRSNGEYAIEFRPSKAGVFKFRAVSEGRRSPALKTFVEPRLKGTFTSVSSSAPKNEGVNDDALVASPDLSTVVYGLARGFYAEHVRTWWLWERKTRAAEPLEFPIDGVCDISDNGRYLLYGYRGLRLLDRRTHESIAIPSPENEYSDVKCGTLDAAASLVAYSAESPETGAEAIFLWDRMTNKTTMAGLPGDIFQAWAYGATISEDGSSVIYGGLACKITKKGGCGKDLGEYAAIWDVATMTTRYLTPPVNNLRFAASPTNRYLAWSYSDCCGPKIDRAEMHLLNVDTGKKDRVTHAKYITFAPTGVSTDGRTVLYEEFDNFGDRASSIYRVGAGYSTALVRYTAHSWTFPYQLSPDGRSVLLSGIMPLRKDDRDGLHRDAYVWRMK